VGKQFCKSRGFILILSEAVTKYHNYGRKVGDFEGRNFEYLDSRSWRIHCTAGWREGWLWFFTTTATVFFAGYFEEMRRAFFIPNRNKISDFFTFLKIISV
jgi:hypothetical protein